MRWDRRGLAIVVVSTLAAAGVAACSDDGAPPDDAGSAELTSTTTSAERAAWRGRLVEIFTPIAQRLQTLLNADREWAAGTVSGPDLAALIDLQLPDFEQAVEDAAADLGPIDAAPRADVYALGAARLYLEFLRIEADAVVRPASPLRDQIHLLARRVRTLADRVFDRAQVAVDPSTFDAENPDIVVTRADPIPDWLALNAAPGPPLEIGSAPAPQGPPSSGVEPTNERLEQWLASLRRVELPPAPSIAASLASGDLAGLRRDAAVLTAATAQAAVLAAAAGHHERTVAFVLTLLIETEAFRLAEGALLSADSAPTDDALIESTRQLSVIADALWEPTLGPHDSGFAPVDN